MTCAEFSVSTAVFRITHYKARWPTPAAQRLRFILDFAYATGLRISELVGVTLRSVHADDHDDHWLRGVGKGQQARQSGLAPTGQVRPAALSGSARTAGHAKHVDSDYQADWCHGFGEADWHISDPALGRDEAVLCNCGQ